MPYTGIDIVPELIADLRSRAEREGSGRVYILADITRDPLPGVDAVLCRDCLVHLSFSNIAAAVANFRQSGSEWLITTTFPEFKANIDCDDGDWRALNFELPPFNWGPPTHLIVESCAEGNGGWADKSLAAWRICNVTAPLGRRRNLNGLAAGAGDKAARPRRRGDRTTVLCLLNG
jgi:hypothetical protein